ncbi:MAG TPA: ABC transporter permease subunit [Candidatus Binatia bacterium]|jgi:NitT/TauT family transport system permease protein|nr:ABC transporter permease subunit [Candidatus Binatia bacterium]
MNKQIALRFLSIVSFLAVWWIGSLFSAPEILPSPAAIGATIVDNFTTPGPEDKTAEFHIGVTLARIFFTFTVAMALGIGLGLLMGLRPKIELAFGWLLPLTLTIPTLLAVFLCVMWFGYSEAGGLFAVILTVTPFVVVNMLAGTKALDKDLIDMARAFKANRRLMIRKVLLWQLMPYIFAAFRYAFGMTWKIVALAETFGLKYGVGYMFTFWFEQFNMTQVMAWIVLFVALMLILEHGIIARIEDKIFAWRPVHAF